MVIMAAIYLAAYRRSALFCRSHSTYVRKMRYLNKLKEDDSLCRQAQTSGTFYIFHNLSPFLQKVGKKYLTPQLSAAEMKRILEKFKETEQWIEKSVLIGCSDEHVPHFALDLAGALEKSVIEAELKGSFTDLRKAFFVVDEKDSSLLASAQALLRWHDSHQYCSKTGQPTQKNVAGSKRVCHASGITYYPQMSPVVIILVSDGSRCLLARQASFPQGMYTALSGFCDIGEAVEEAARREVAEEVGLEVESLWYSASQHWPFPSSCLMIACHALVRRQQLEISMNSLELEEARWFGLEEIMEGLKREPNSAKQDNGRFLPWFPPKQAIAHKLINEWVKQQTSQSTQVL
ncbi:nucleoside diphosphate-linked moiety X motif 13 isoform X1 [Meleagris gallopavo]|uniref:nucleoside diphosphate-linked moiety X motif 13 isoform X1 n=1 Tax=Meleagris gallopavo TaxID=9103 RepID=UPI000938B1CE|nr:nucleoside diphosphate-linked moiety X motif 13 isoform X1 [Meleagris gallopavo]XP_019473100.1 nucleoside diphosphate-linked moiety X motif 13 isoform X1 [Meleagris gallopavo]